MKNKLIILVKKNSNIFRYLFRWKMRHFLPFIVFFTFLGCRLIAVDPVYNYSVKIINDSNENLKLVSYNRNIKYDSIEIKKNNFFIKEINYSPYKNPNYSIWSNENDGKRNLVICTFENKRSLKISEDIYAVKYQWLFWNHINEKKGKGFKIFKPSTNTMNFGTYKYCFTKEDYEKASPL